MGCDVLCRYRSCVPLSSGAVTVSDFFAVVICTGPNIIPICVAQYGVAHGLSLPKIERFLDTNIRRTKKRSYNRLGGVVVGGFDEPTAI